MDALNVVYGVMQGAVTRGRGPIPGSYGFFRKPQPSRDLGIPQTEPYEASQSCIVNNSATSNDDLVHLILKHAIAHQHPQSHNPRPLHIASLHRRRPAQIANSRPRPPLRLPQAPRRSPRAERARSARPQHRALHIHRSLARRHTERRVSDPAISQSRQG